VFEELFEIFEEKMTNARESIRDKNGGQAKSISEIVGGRIADAAAERAAKALAAGQDVWLGLLSSDGGGVESFFCCESFELDSPRLYVNALRCAW
jgi:hypothetical protein